jgi:polysaccharide biosynthesis protein PslG
VGAAHARWIRVDLNWNVIQNNGPTSYNWAPFDNVINAARSRGIKVLGILTYTPAWARPAGTTSHSPPSDPNTFANFARTAAAHFGAEGVHHYEIWNEPNISAFWAPNPDPVRYTRLLTLASAAIRAADPSAFIVSGGLSPWGSYGGRDAGHINPITFLEGIYANGGRGSFDAVGWHPYNFPYGTAYYGWSAWSQMSATSPSARSVMTANGDGAKQIWPTEFGEPTGASSRSVTESAQAKFVTDAYAALKGWSWAGPAFLYSFHDNGTDALNIEDNFGVIRFDWTPKPAYTAFQSAAATG